MNDYESWIITYVERNPPVNGKCLDACRAMRLVFPELIMQRGYVQDRSFRRPHWWLIDPDGNIIDPTASQFLCIDEYISLPDDIDEPTGRCLTCGEDAFRGSASCSPECAELLGIELNGLRENAI